MLREDLKQHMEKFPFSMHLLFEGNKTAYGMDLFIESEFIDEAPNIAECYLNVDKFISYRSDEPNPSNVDFVVLWGVSSIDVNSNKLFSYAQRYSKPILIIEDGFIRSFYPMSFGELSSSMRFDPEGCYYDSNFPSAIENLLNSDFILDQKMESYIDKSISRIVNNNITKYSSGNIYKLDKKRDVKGSVLVIDQVYGDMSIKLGGINDDEFDMILEKAITENEGYEIIVKLHPESVLGIRKGHFSVEDLVKRGITVIYDNVNSISLLKQVDKVYCATTQMGFEALLCGKEVHVFGCPFYSGWGRTIDRKNIQRRNKERGIKDLFYSAYIYNTIYVNPITKKRCDLSDILSYFEMYINNSDYLSDIKQKRLDLRIQRLESKIKEIEPLKEASVTLNYHIKRIKNNIMFRFGQKVEFLFYLVERVTEKFWGYFKKLFKE
ncbi:capsular polysaccharide export protein, LipB/KpsS family [Vibrio spartinae]|uniref:Capsule polysaccharide biosynthesis protein n=1 Tax=Vibrio spartinae TaxID=1918945 RepID=A0A1N6M2Q1_9VIBR|nr:hypothetical protein [Vibrio spartinae]SIO93714.1 Capsule polysaccharide biosynthesis protein [Vibrio spartinae]